MIRILKLKHWQLFILIMIAPIIGSFVVVTLMISNPEKTDKLQELFLLLNLISSLIFLFWLLSVNMYLNKKMPTGGIFNLNLFRICLAFCFLFLIYFQFEASKIIGQSNIDSVFSLQIIFFVASSALLYCIYIVAKEIDIAEFGVRDSKKDLLKNMLIICLFPIGIWIMQPRLNKILKNHKEIIT